MTVVKVRCRCHVLERWAALLMPTGGFSEATGLLREESVPGSLCHCLRCDLGRLTAPPWPFPHLDSGDEDATYPCPPLGSWENVGR